MSKVKAHSFSVREVHQAGPRCHIVKYHAQMELHPGGQPVCVSILNVLPPDSPAERVEVARQMVQRGAERALEKTGMSARLWVHEFAIHPVDFHPARIEEFTFEAIRRVLDDNGL